MSVMIESIVICLMMWGICYLNTGNDDKNMIGYRSYPTEVQNKLKQLPKYVDKIKEPDMRKILITNTLLFLVVLFIFGVIVKADSFIENFLHVFIVGEVLNLFDLIVIDLFWWRNTKRIRFSEIPEKEPYQNPKKHLDSFGRGCIMYLVIALIDGFVLTII